MTIFDTIRYPVGMPPTAEELLAIPHPIFQAWSNTHFYGREPAHAAMVLQGFWMNDRDDCVVYAYRGTVMNTVGNLRKLIAEME